MASMYLTIDDGPSEDFVSKIDFLVSKKVPAVFFCNGKLMDTRREDIIYAIKKGFIIGNHCYTHKAFSLLSEEECEREIRKCDEIIDACYIGAGVKKPAKVFRFPYGDKGGSLAKGLSEEEIRKRIIANQQILKNLSYSQPSFDSIKSVQFNKMQELDHLDVYWTFDFMEWKLRKPRPDSDIKTEADVFGKVDEMIATGQNQVLLIHDHVETALLFRKIIERLLAAGVEFRLPDFNH